MNYLCLGRTHALQNKFNWAPIRNTYNNSFHAPPPHPNGNCSLSNTGKITQDTHNKLKLNGVFIQLCDISNITSVTTRQDSNTTASAPALYNGILEMRPTSTVTGHQWLSDRHFVTMSRSKQLNCAQPHDSRFNSITASDMYYTA